MRLSKCLLLEEVHRILLDRFFILSESRIIRSHRLGGGIWALRILITNQFSIYTLTQRILIWAHLILLSIQEYLIYVIVIIVVNVADVWGLNDGDGLLLLRHLHGLVVPLTKVGLGLDDGRGEILLKRWTVLLQGFILAQDAMTHGEGTSCHVSDGTAGCGDWPTHTKRRQCLLVGSRVISSITVLQVEVKSPVLGATANPLRVADICLRTLLALTCGCGLARVNYVLPHLNRSSVVLNLLLLLASRGWLRDSIPFPIYVFGHLNRRQWCSLAQSSILRRFELLHADLRHVMLITIMLTGYKAVVQILKLSPRGQHHRWINPTQVRWVVLLLCHLLQLQKVLLNFDVLEVTIRGTIV